MTQNFKSGRLRGRLAPSPTGALHLGNARTFMIAWLSVRSRSGTLLLRMEDLDHPKNKPGAADAALADLRWLGLDWDEGPDIGGPYAPYTQTQRRIHYVRALETLRARGLAYPASARGRCRVRPVRASHRRRPLRRSLPRPLCGLRAARRVCPDRLPAWRFRVPQGEIVRFEDGFCGLCEQRSVQSVETSCSRATRTARAICCRGRG